MVRTTPPRPRDLTAQFPEMVGLSRPAVRLHPRRGEPSVADSSIGGPLLWPADEAWPTCAAHIGDELTGTRPADEFLRRLIIDAGWRRDPELGPATAAEREQLAGLGDITVRAERPVPMLAVAQLFARDIPQIPFQDGNDLLQVLWCPFSHPESYEPRVSVTWRSSDEVGAVAQPPVPEVVDSGYLPQPCVLHPELVTEYPQDLQDLEVWQEIDRWADPYCYAYDLSVAPGCKVGGHAPWGPTDPFPMVCAECGADVTPLLTLDSSEWDGGTFSWQPVEEEDHRYMFLTAASATELMIGRSERLQLYACTASSAHPVVQNMQ
ncbi:hypothetical protein [Mycobacterium sp. 48b]|uniref:hypothetical protein n=1 Tax=Mycobacterium sp. 48b TaxID=3400426 RepID=UPI003AAF3C34